jgi:D-arabinose 1-dehydrogenase-like Zn-dependent alcohol dehydrogenase
VSIAKSCTFLHFWQAAAGTMDGIIDCVSAKHQLLPLISLLKYHGKIILVGAPAEPLELSAASLILGSWKYNLFSSFLVHHLTVVINNCMPNHLLHFSWDRMES